MVKKLDQVSKIIQVGTSIGITIHKNIQKILNLKTGDYVKISIEKIEAKEDF